jgi:hypothetical protein
MPRGEKCNESAKEDKNLTYCNIDSKLPGIANCGTAFKKPAAQSTLADAYFYSPVAVIRNAVFFP